MLAQRKGPPDTSQRVRLQSCHSGSTSVCPTWPKDAGSSALLVMHACLECRLRSATSPEVRWFMHTEARTRGKAAEYGASLNGIVKLLRRIWSPGNRRYFPDVIATDPPLRRPALSPLLPPNSRIAAASLGGTPARTADAVEDGSVGPWGHMPTRSAGHAPLICTPACDTRTGVWGDGSAHTGC